MNTMNEEVFRRFAEKVGLPDPETGCMEWIASRGDRGYGTLRVSGRMARAHRLSYGHFVDTIPDGLVIDHVCRNRACVNPAHLTAVTSRENTHAPGSEARAAKQSARTHCPRGHELSGVNLKPSDLRRGKRSCLACGRASAARSDAKKRGELWTDEQFKADADRRYAEIQGGVS